MSTRTVIQDLLIVFVALGVALCIVLAWQEREIEILQQRCQALDEGYHSLLVRVNRLEHPELINPEEG
jgi:hypothetical protein